MNDDHYRKLERLYASAPVNDFYDPELTIHEGEAELVTPVSESHFHAANAVHGSVYFKVLDDAAFFAANSLVEDVFVLTTEFNIYLERPVSDGEITAVGEVVNDNPRQLIAESVAFDSDGNEIARGSGTFQRSSIDLTPDVGYE
ncbi:PaaI family thioesterase [Haloarchaeobius sp. DFWS5]|uniref:PaaI family thioesterase n=1 Tax=Haloarchaeobius sp. DFWS5 TaxID=3446114 RepID=UPI003EB9D8E4